MEVDRHVEAPRPQRPRQAHVVDDPPDASRVIDHDHVVEVRVPEHDRSGGALDQVGEPGVGEVPAQGAHASAS